METTAKFEISAITVIVALRFESTFGVGEYGIQDSSVSVNIYTLIVLNTLLNHVSVSCK